MLNFDRVLSFIFSRISSQLHEDWCIHFRDWTMPGFRAVVVYRFGAMLLSNQKRGVLKRLSLVLYRTMYRYIRNHYGIELPASAIVGRRLLIGHQSGIVIHSKAVIGDDCVLHQNVTIGEASSHRPWEIPKLGNRVTVGAGAVIIGGIVISDDVHIGPNVTVMTNIPAGTTILPPLSRLIPWSSRRTILPHGNNQVEPPPSGREQGSVASNE